MFRVFRRLTNGQTPNDDPPRGHHVRIFPDVQCADCRLLMILKSQLAQLNQLIIILHVVMYSCTHV